MNRPKLSNSLDALILKITRIFYSPNILMDGRDHVQVNCSLKRKSYKKHDD